MTIPYWRRINSAPIGPWLLVRRKAPHSEEYNFVCGYFRTEHDRNTLRLRIGGGVSINLNLDFNPQYIVCAHLNELESKS